MKALTIVPLALIFAGCSAPSRFAHDPRAAVVGPDYLETIAEYPRDRDTQYYYPVFSTSGAAQTTEPSASPAPSAADSSLDALLVNIPQPTPDGKAVTGKGWRELEQVGIPFSLPANPSPAAQ